MKKQNIKKETVIILVNYNGFADTQACLQSITQIQGELPFVIIVDNASTEDRDLEELHQFYPQIKLIYNQENIGFGRANNVGIKWAQKNIDFEYLLLLNNDTLIEPYTLYYLKEAFKVDQGIGITTGKTMYEGNRELVWYGGGEINYKRGWPKIADYNQKPTPEGADKARFVSFASGCVMMFTKQSITDLKGFDDDFFMYCEDLELCMRTKNLGYKLYYQPKSVIYHKVQGSSKTSATKPTGLHPKNPNSNFLFYHLKSNQWIILRKHLSGFNFFLFNIYFWPEMTFKFLKFMVFGRFCMLNTYFKTIKRIISYNKKGS